MSDRYSEDYLRDMDEAIRLALEFTEGMDFEAFRQDKKTIFAVIRAIQILGEAVKKIPEPLRQRYPEIPWKDIAKMRDKVTHQYFSVNLDVVWDTIQHDLPLLQPLLTSVLENFQE